MNATRITIEKAWDGNECAREVNRRIYLSRGRWQWVVVIDGEADSSHDRKCDAMARAEVIRKGTK